MEYGKIKLIIWDLDDTFWQGTLSEGGIVPIERNINLVKILADRGIVNAICSKNDWSPVEEKLVELDVRDLFVFPSVDWSPKGPRISQMLKEMGLRAANTLFIDDNVVNLNEALHYEPTLMVAGPKVIGELEEYFSAKPVSDPMHKRLAQYKILEEKKASRESYADNESFLYASKTEVEIKRDCISQIDRIYELVQRTNQLNYTKLRSTREELTTLLEDDGINAGYVTVKDAFGDYGIVGFFAVRNNKCVHFLFSCRTIGQGVEQYVYAKLGCPELSVNGIVINNVTKSPAPGWINQKTVRNSNAEISEKINGKIVFKGPCDLMGLTSYLNASNMICEFTYISEKRHNNIEHQGCMTNYLQIPSLGKEDVDLLVKDCIFNDERMFQTSIYDQDVKLIFISSLQEFHFGIYCNKKKGYRIAFGEWNHPLTDPNEWDAYINDSVWTSSNHFTRTFLEKFSEEWEYIGRKEYDEYISELDEFMNKISPTAHVCIFLGSEIPYSGITTDAWKDRHIIHREINNRLREYEKNNPRLHLIDYTEFIRSDKDYTDSIDHMQRYIHYKVAQRANEIIRNVLGQGVNQSGKFKIILNQLRDIITNLHVALIDWRKKRRIHRL